tara:strand:+ start:171 stop:536 length:366 start_codon:yes stop_codon:yes gene_type:complete
MEIKLTEKQSDLLQCIIDKCYDVEDYMNPFLEPDKSVAKKDGRYIYYTNWYHNGWGKWDLCKNSLGDIIKFAETYNTNGINAKYLDSLIHPYLRSPILIRKQLLVLNNLIKKLETAREELV